MPKRQHQNKKETTFTNGILLSIIKIIKFFFYFFFFKEL